jgi:hypothetical protein
MRTIGAIAAVTCGALLLGLGALACNEAMPRGRDGSVASGGSKDPSKWPVDDHSMCDWKNKPELEISETAGPGSYRPNVRRVYKMIGEGDARHKVLVCREVDSNLDGIKDVVRTFNAKGEALKEDADSNYDGKLDIWSSFVAGRMSEEDVDTNADGAPDVWKVYVEGRLQRVKRDRNHDGKPDVWEIYNNGQLERMGIDDNFDGHVDRWDRDESVRDQASGGGGTTQPSGGTAAPAASAADAGAPAARDGGK